MSQTNESAKLTLLAAAALTEFTGVTIDTNGKAAVAGAGSNHDGIVQGNYASGDPAYVLLHNGGGTRKITAAGTTAIGDLLYAAANGKVSTTASGRALYRALEAASGDGAIIEVEPLPAMEPDVVEGTYTAIAADGVAGYADFVTGFSTNPRVVLANGRSSAGAMRALANITFPSTGTVRLTITSLATNDIINYRFVK